MFLNIFILAFALSQVAGDLLSQSKLVEVQPTSVFRPNPCSQPSARQFEPNPRGCSWYWMCKNGAGAPLDPPVEGICGYDLHFNATGQLCGYPAEIEPLCRYDEINSIVTTECSEHNPVPLFPHPFMCNKYLHCFSNLIIERECESGQHFSYFDNGCVSEELAQCNVVDRYCSSFGPDKIVKRNAFTCDKYHVCTKCNDRYAIAELTCSGEDHLFSDEFGHCTIRSNVENCTVSINCS